MNPREVRLLARSLILVFMKRSKALLLYTNSMGESQVGLYACLAFQTRLWRSGGPYVSLLAITSTRARILYFTNITRTPDFRFLKCDLTFIYSTNHFVVIMKKVNNVKLYELILWVKTWSRWEFRFITPKHALTYVKSLT